MGHRINVVYVSRFLACVNWTRESALLKWTTESANARKIETKEIRKKVKAIEDKNTDRNTNVAKKKAWVEVEESFKSLCTGGRRSLAQLKSQWTATKVVARKRVAEHRKEVKKTGGGDAPPEIPVSSEDINVWLPNEFIVDSNDFDSDAVPVQRDENLEDKPDRFGQYLETESDTPEEVNISQNCPSLSCNSKKKTLTKMESQTHAQVKRIYGIRNAVQERITRAENGGAEKKKLEISI